MPVDQPEVSIIAPALDEEQNLRALVERTSSALSQANLSFELLVVLDGGTDGSLALLERLAEEHSGLGAIQLAPNSGQHSAVFEGLRYAAGRYVVTIDSDLQNPPEAIPAVVAVLKTGIEAVGTVRGGRQDSAVRKMASRWFSFSQLALRVRHVMTDPGCMLRGWSGAVVQRFLNTSENPWYLPLQLNQHALSYQELETGHSARQAGTSRYGAGELARLYVATLRARVSPGRRRPISPDVISLHGVLEGQARSG